MDVDELGALLRRAREATGVSQGDLARMSGLSRATVNYAERGRVAIGTDALLSLFDLLGITLTSPSHQSPPDAALRLLSQSASVSFRDDLTPSMLEDALSSGEVADQWLPHIATVLDESSDRLLLRGVREVAARTGQAPERVWRNAQKLAARIASPNPRWRHAV